MLFVDLSVLGQCSPPAPAYLHVEHSSPDAPEYDDFCAFSVYCLRFIKTPTQMTTTTRTAAATAAPMNSVVEEFCSEVLGELFSLSSVDSISRNSLEEGRVLKMAQELGPLVLMQSLYSEEGWRSSYLK